MGEGRIIKALSGFYYVESGDKTICCRARGRFRHTGESPLVGDLTEYTPVSEGEGVIDAILPRKNFFSRPPVANIDQMVIVASRAIPVTDPFLIDRMTAIAVSAGAEPIVCVNKSDMDPAGELIGIYRLAGIKTVLTSAVTGEGIEELEALLQGRSSVFTGNSGVGKSSILNRLDPAFNIPTGEVSEKLGRGRHTTRHVEIFRTARGAYIADTPGFAAFDIESAELSDPQALQHAFPEFEPYIGACKFVGCSHTGEKGCAVLEALRQGLIAPTRHRSYVRLYEQLSSVKEWERRDKKTAK